MRAAPLALVCLLTGACFEPAPHEGFACGLDDWCPGPLFCAADHTCRRVDPPGDGSVGDGGRPLGPPNYAFVTSTMFLASSLMTVAGADDECTKIASAAGLPGRYVAWLSVAGQRARDRLGPASGWRRTDDKPFARDVSALLAGNILYPLRKTETGAELSGDVLTGTNSDGEADENCADLTSSSRSDLIFIGDSTGGTGLWTATSDNLCDQPGHLYCLQIDYQQPVIPARTPGPLAFVSKLYMAMGGLAGADAACMDDAMKANLSGTFKALLSTTTMAALDRFQPLPSTPWVRVDGIATTRDFMTWDAPINVTAAGSYTSQPVFSGAASPRQTSSTQSESCNDWTDISGTVALIGSAASASAKAFGFDTGGRCNGGSYYCLQVP